MADPSAFPPDQSSGPRPPLKPGVRLRALPGIPEPDPWILQSAHLEAQQIARDAQFCQQEWDDIDAWAERHDDGTAELMGNDKPTPADYERGRKGVRHG